MTHDKRLNTELKMGDNYILFFLFIDSWFISDNLSHGGICSQVLMVSMKKNET